MWREHDQENSSPNYSLICLGRTTSRGLHQWIAHSGVWLLNQQMVKTDHVHSNLSADFMPCQTEAPAFIQQIEIKHMSIAQKSTNNTQPSPSPKRSSTLQRSSLASSTQPLCNSHKTGNTRSLPTLQMRWPALIIIMLITNTLLLMLQRMASEVMVIIGLITLKIT